MNVTITRGEAAELLLQSARYALGRRTFITGIVSGFTAVMAPRLTPDERARITALIADHENGRGLGDEHNAADWARARSALEAESGMPDPDEAITLRESDAFLLLMSALRWAMSDRIADPIELELVRAITPQLRQGDRELVVREMLAEEGTAGLSGGRVDPAWTELRKEIAAAG